MHRFHCASVSLCIRFEGFQGKRQGAVDCAPRLLAWNTSWWLRAGFVSPVLGRQRLPKNLEPVVRWDRLDQLDTPEGYAQHRWTFGLNYWLASSSVAKIAYTVDDKDGLGSNEDALMVPFATGF